MGRYRRKAYNNADRGGLIAERYVVAYCDILEAFLGALHRDESVTYANFTHEGRYLILTPKIPLVRGTYDSAA